jgi:hypothetical protein
VKARLLERDRSRRLGRRGSAVGTGLHDDPPAQDEDALTLPHDVRRAGMKPTPDFVEESTSTVTSTPVADL